ncbi:hypothetical protein [Mesorhizobium sp. B2-7-1]|uniref:hypothetical protein n=1 Tax=Mesorhizobium sp. B2-7-1 TaxID=2589909 RepID=UPI00112E61FB|nr:hypothetical protein [Mesorhizobium sp. B2-7-1]TPJ66519.1 hypothetical protein FJ471_13815 [Mesorhizobium sp. B2-7-1]
MFVPAALRSCVVFIGIKKEDGRFLPKATGFLVDAGEGSFLRAHLVTAEHVVMHVTNLVAASKTKDAMAVRLNTVDGGTQTVDLTGVHWWHHPDLENLSDVAVTPFSFAREQFDHAPLWVFNRDLSNEIVRAEGGALGQEILILGLFRYHTGSLRNEPIIRVGNLSAMPAEPLWTSHAGHIEGYLVEARSISGLSGSPVFLNLMDVHSSRVTVTPEDWSTAMETKASKDTFFIAPDHNEKGLLAALAEMRLDNAVDLGRYPLLGLMHGHWDLPGSEAAVIEDVGERKESVNVGVGIVIPARKILETLYQEELVNERSRLEAEERQKNGAVPDVISDSDDAGQDQSASAANPSHREDFTSLLNAAARKHKRDD